jgi:twitching motility protein PilT
MRLYRENQITFEEAVKNCTNPAEFDLRARGIHSASDSTWESFEQEKTG